MRIEDQVTNLKLSQQLRELGIKQDSYFYWCNAGNDSELYGGLDMDEARINDHFKPEEVLMDERKHYWVYYSAFTIAELGEILPWEFQDGMDRGRLVLEKSFGKEKWRATYVDLSTHGRFANASSEINLVDSMAKLLIYLKEQKLI